MNRTAAALRLLCLLAALGAGGRPARAGVAAAPVELREGEIVIPTYPWGPDNPNPSFQSLDGRGIYPYPMQDNLGRERVDRRYETVELENEFLHVVLIPALGGHVHSVFDKSTGAQVFYVNQVVKPGLIGMRGAWISGGIEFNTGPQGHTVSAVAPLRWAAGRREDGSAWIAVGERERIHETQWVVEVSLRRGRSLLEERIRIANPTLLPRIFYYWNCTAVPNTPGMQFVYPMTLGTDHAGTRFYRWPIDGGVDLSMSRNYRQPSSIFAYECDQDFFGSYDHDADRGVVAYANRHLVPGKKAWTWGLGDDGIVAQSTLTDDGSLYNEVQTGPLRTQADYGLLAPRQTLEWREWWYPVHGLGGAFEFATRDVAARVVRSGGSELELRLIGTGRWPRATVHLRRGEQLLGRQAVAIDPARPARLRFVVPDPAAPVEIEVRAGKLLLARFISPLALPERQPPAAEEPAPESSAYARLRRGAMAERAGNLVEARAEYAAALERDPRLAPGMLASGVVDLKEQRWCRAEAQLRRALAADPDLGPGAAYLSWTLLRQGRMGEAVDWAWQAARRPESAGLGHWLVGALALADAHAGPQAALNAFSQAVGRDGKDLSTRLGLAIAQHRLGRDEEARGQLRQILRHDPLDAPARALAELWDATALLPEMGPGIRGHAQPVLDAACACLDLGAPDLARAILERQWRDCPEPERESHPMPWYLLAYLAGSAPAAADALARGADSSLDYVFPHRDREAEVLRARLEADPQDWRAAYLLGTLLYARNRTGEGATLWEEAYRRGGRYSVLSRDLAWHCWRVEEDRDRAATRFAEAIALRPEDPTLYRDLASLEADRERWEAAIALLERAAALPVQRSDVLEALGRAYHHLGHDEDAAALLDRSTFAAWEGQQSMHVLFVDVHLALGEKALAEGGDPVAAEREFRRAFEYPRNLGVGRADNVDQRRLWRALARALAAQGREVEAAEALARAGTQEGAVP